MLHGTVSPQGTITAAKQALSTVDRSGVAAVGVSGQQHGMVVLGSDDSVLRPAKLWCDTESAGEAAELSEKLGYTVVSDTLHAAGICLLVVIIINSMILIYF